VLTCYGGCADPHYDPSACNHSTACGPVANGNWWYATEEMAFYCGARLKIERDGKCVVVDVEDNGPADWVESNAQSKCGTPYIIDTSPLVADYFGGGCGWGECFLVQVSPVPDGTPTGPCAPPNHPPGGWVDGVSADCDKIAGWAKDPDTPDAQLAVHLYVDGPTGDPKAAGFSTVANVSRADVGPHGFALTIPYGFRDNKPHPVFGYTFDSKDGTPVALNGNPKTIQCAPPKPPLDPRQGQKRWVAGPSSFGAWKFSAYELARLGDAEIAAYPDGLALPIQPKVVQADDGTPQVWVIDGAVRRHVVDPTSFGAWRFDAKSVQRWPPSQVYAYPRSKDWRPAPFLMQGAKPEVYVLDERLDELDNAGVVRVPAETDAGIAHGSGAADAAWPEPARSATVGPAAQPAPPPDNVEAPGACSFASRRTVPGAWGLSACALVAFGAVLGRRLARRPRQAGAGPGARDRRRPSRACRAVRLVRLRPILGLAVAAFAATLALPVRAADPTSYLDGVDGACQKVTGWAQDPDTPDKALAVHVYFGGAAGAAGALGIPIVADVPRPAPCAPNTGSCAHGFEVAIPFGFRDGQPHEVHAYTFDTTDGQPRTIHGSPKGVLCDRPALPMAPSKGVKRWVTSQADLQAWHLSAADVVQVGKADLAAYPDGLSFPPQPVVVQMEPERGPGSMWLIDGKYRRRISSESFAAWGFDPKAASRWPDSQVSAYEEGTAWRPSPFLVRWPGDPAVYALDEPLLPAPEPEPSPAPEAGVDAKTDAGSDATSGVAPAAESAEPRAEVACTAAVARGSAHAAGVVGACLAALAAALARKGRRRCRPKGAP
jgi:hypothetical protein